LLHQLRNPGRDGTYPNIPSLSTVRKKGDSLLLSDYFRAHSELKNRVSLI